MQFYEKMLEINIPFHQMLFLEKIKQQFQERHGDLYNCPL